MEENAWYSVVSSEGCASILWKDSNKVHEACDCLHLTAADLLELGVIDMVLPEEDPKDSSPISSLEAHLAHKLPQLMVLSAEDVAQQRWCKVPQVRYAERRNLIILNNPTEPHYGSVGFYFNCAPESLPALLLGFCLPFFCGAPSAVTALARECAAGAFPVSGSPPKRNPLEFAAPPKSPCIP